MVPAPAVQSSATSTPLPPVISMMRASGSSFCTSITWSAPSFLATSRRARSFEVPVTMMSEAPACLQITVCDRPCWPGPLDQHRRVVADAAVEQRPLDAVRHRRHQARRAPA